MLVTLLLLLALTCGAAIALGMLIVGLFEAPWLLLLVLLCLGLLGLQKLAAYAIAEEDVASDVSPPAKTNHSVQPDSPANDSPTFTYRGVKYSAASLKNLDEESTTVSEGVYRGQPWRRNNTAPAKSPSSSSKPSSEIKYRGHTVKDT